MAVFRLHFKWQDKDYVVRARSLDMTHPYFVAIKDLILPTKDGILLNPADDDVRRLFGEARQIMLPLQSVSLIEELNDENRVEQHKVKQFPGRNDNPSETSE